MQVGFHYPFDRTEKDTERILGAWPVIIQFSVSLSGAQNESTKEVHSPLIDSSTLMDKIYIKMINVLRGICQQMEKNQVTSYFVQR